MGHSDGARVQVRRMTMDDVAEIDPVLCAAYGMPLSYRDRLESHLRQRGILPLIAEYDGRIAGAVFGNDYGTSAYVSLMGVDPALQGRGIGNALMKALIAWCDERGFRDVRLDATDAGAPMYERFGFADFGRTVVFERRRAFESAPIARAITMLTHDAATIVRVDEAAFGADRSPVLEPLVAAHGALVAEDGRGYVVVRPSVAHTLVGPWIARDAGVAGELFDAALARLGDGKPAVFVPEHNQAAVDIVTAAGFVVARALRHMIRGAGAMPSPAVFGRASLGQG